MLAMILIPALIVYLWLVYRFIRKYLRDWVVEIDKTVDADTHRLARFVHLVLHILHSLTFFVAIIWPVIWVVLSVSQIGNEIAPDIEIATGFRFDLEQFAGLGLDNVASRELEGSMEIKTGANWSQWILYSLSQEIIGLLALFVLLQLKNIFAAICNNAAFTYENVWRLRKIGEVYLAGTVAFPLLQFMQWAAVIDHLQSTNPGLTLTADFSMDILFDLLIGLAILVLSGVLKEAIQVHEEQRLTI